MKPYPPALLLVLCFCIFSDLSAQQYPLYSQYMFDGYLINPSMLATSKKSEINLLYRQQWAGFDDGPKTIQFNYQHAFSNRLALGLNVFDDKTVLLSSTSVMATFGYKVPIATNHVLGFGLSGGFFSNRIKLEEIPDVDINDPAILNSMANNFAFDGQFGFNYNFQNLSIGFSLVRLIDNRTLSETRVQEIKFSQLKNKIISASYKFQLTNEFSFQPNFAYRFTADDLNFFETSGVFSYKETFYLGGGYRHEFGPTAMVRVAWKDFQIGYAYDLPSTRINVSTGGTSEIQLKWRFGPEIEKPKRNKITPLNDTKDEPKPDDNNKLTEGQKHQEINKVTEEQARVSEPLVNQENKLEPKEPTISESDEIINEQIEYILIVGTFERSYNAEKLVREMSQQGIIAESIKIEGSSYHYVHLPQYKTNNITIEKLQEIRKNQLFKDAWFKRIDKK
ncbi:MAG: type IX secretion system membrane protein PorP/SprF [Cyclobacteriaceae bacterium]|nr:type IX secretion system membrane protein PorP/SprF [Cyclobacteriaceae bacterium]